MSAPVASFPDRLSPAAIGRFRLCPKSFFMADVERMPREEQPNPQFCQANAIHHALERFFGLPAVDRRPENLERALRSVWPTHRRPGAFVSREQEAAYGLEALEMLRRFGERFNLNTRPLAREEWVQARVRGAELFGKVDRIDAVPTAGAAAAAEAGMPVDGREVIGLELVDYKTGRVELDEDDLRHEPAAQVYLLATEASYRLPVERVRFIYLRSGHDISWYPEREDVEALGERVLELVGEMRGEIEFEARPGSHCRFCPVARRCPDRQSVTLADLVPVEEMAF